tara:strand:- start:6 stop:929 length:924 start_codon:yes stop_codon:yes gene_type:complete
MEGIKTTPEWLSKYNLDHFSPSQLASPLCVWLFKYILLNQKERRVLPVGSKAHGGNGAALAITHLLAQNIKGSEFYMCDEATKTIRIPPKKYRDALAAGLRVLHQNLGWNDKEKEQRFANKDSLPGVVENALAALEPELIKGKENKIFCEEYISLQLTDVVVPIIGRLDYRKDNNFYELKTKWSRRGKIKKDGTRSFYQTKCPATPQIAHVKQVAVYWKATGYKPHLVYASDVDQIVFHEGNCEQMKPKYLEEMLQEVRVAAIARQKIIQQSSTAQEAAMLVQPQWDHFMWDMPGEWLSRAKDLWRY